MSEKTRKFLLALGENPKLVEEFKQDPTAVMSKYEVPDDHQEMIRAGDQDGLKKSAGLDDDTLQFMIL
jgi:hypothetical protein